jgi:hypothetical protein
MRSSLRWFSLVVCLVALGSVARGDEKNGVQFNVSKTTLDRSDQRAGYYYSTRIDRTEALKVSVKNGSFKPMAEGEVRWEILVRKYASSVVESMSGVEKLKPLRPAEGVDIVIGGAQVQGWRDGSYQAKDKIEWQVVLFVDGKEFMKSNSTAAFDALAKRATKIEPPKK